MVGEFCRAPGFCHARNPTTTETDPEDLAAVQTFFVCSASKSKT